MIRLKRRTLVLDIAAALLIFVAAFGFTNALREGRVPHEDGALLSEYEEARLSLDALEERHAALTAANLDLVAKRDELFRLLGEPGNNPELVSEWQDAALLAGMTSVSGEGLRLSLNDKPNYDPLLDPVESLVHDKTLLHILTLLTDSGAAAMSVNGVRLTALSQIYCIGPTILCNVHRLAPPYEITVLGPADRLTEVLRADPWLLRLTDDSIGVRLSIVSDPAVVVPSFADRGDYLNHISLLEVP